MSISISTDYGDGNTIFSLNGETAFELPPDMRSYDKFILLNESTEPVDITTLNGDLIDGVSAFSLAGLTSVQVRRIEGVWRSTSNSTSQIPSGGSGAAALDLSGAATQAALATFARTRATILYAVDYGVVADDATDNTTALQAALDATTSSGAIIVLPAGRMRHSGTIYVRKPYITLQGVGPGTRSAQFDNEDPGAITGVGSKLVCTAAVDSIRITPAQDAAAKDRMGGITLRDFGIVGTAINNSAWGIKSEKLSGNPDLYGSTDDLLIDRVAITKCGGGILVVNNDITKIVNCWPTECGQGIEISGGFYIQITNTCIADNPGFGIKMGNVLGVLGTCITGNVIVRNGGEAVWLTGVTRDVSITGNTIRNDTGNPAIVSFLNLLRLDTGVVRNTISGNSFTALAGTGFLIDNGAIGNVFSGNQMDNFSPNYGTGKNWVDGWESVWTAPTFLNSWVNFGSGLEVASYRRSRTGRVQIQGTVKSGTVSNSTPVFTLPAGYRPAATQLLAAISNDGIIDYVSRLAIATTGDVRIETGGNTFAQLSCEFSIASFTA